MPLQCIEYAPNETHQVKPPAYANTTGKPLLSSCHLKHISCQFCKKWVEKEQNIPKLFPLIVFEACPFMIQKLHVPSEDSSPVTATHITIYYYMSDSVLHVIPNLPLNLHNSCICKSLPTGPDTDYWYHSSHIMFRCALLFLILSESVTNKQYQ